MQIEVETWNESVFSDSFVVKLIQVVKNSFQVPNKSFYFFSGSCLTSCTLTL